MKRFYANILFQCTKVLFMLSYDICWLKNKTGGSLRLLLIQLLKDVSHLHNKVRIEAVRALSELLEEAEAALEESDRKIKAKEQELSDRLKHETP
jgi:hypothetical protein